MLLILIRVAPLATSIALLVSNLWQRHAFHAWRYPALGMRSPGTVLPHWHIRFSSSSIIELAVEFSVGVAAGAANLYIRTDGDEAARPWYAASLAFTLAHLVFSKQALDGLKGAQRVDELGEGKGKENLAALERWLAVNRVRFLVSEVPALVAALVAISLGLKVA